MAIYFIQDQTTFLIKIGFTDGDPAGRLAALQTGNPSGLVLLQERPGDKAVERRLHERFAAARERGEWFRPVPEILADLVAYRDPAELTVSDLLDRLEDYQERVRSGQNHFDSFDQDAGMLAHDLGCSSDYLAYITGADEPPEQLASAGYESVICRNCGTPCCGFEVHKSSDGRRHVIRVCEDCNAAALACLIRPAAAPGV